MLNLNNTNSSVILARELNKVFDFFFPTIDIPASLRKRVADLKTHPLGYVERIRLIEELAELSPGDPDSPEGVRFAVMMAHLHFRQSECAKFPGKKTKRALINLMAALYDLDHGIVWPLLQPTTVSHRAKDSLRAEEAKKRTAAACELLKRRGRALPEAAGQVAKLLAPHKEQLGIGDISREKVVHWRKRFCRDREINVLIAQFSDRSLNPNTIHFFFHHGSAFVFFKRPTLVSPPA